jgi:ribose transport system ATP-binding protein
MLGGTTKTGETAAVSLAGLTKRFSGVPALDGVDLEIHPGEVHGLLGENGSGKSTLIKVLAGFHSVDEGTMSVAGVPEPLPMAPGRPADLGFQFVHQNLGLIESLSVVENLRISDMAERRLKISWPDERRKARAVFERYGIDLDPGMLVGNARPVQRAQLAIARAMEGIRAAGSGASGLLVLDEPTVFLPRDEVDHLFALVKEVVAQGASVLFVSHDIDEVRRITDRVTVLRDGRLAGTAVTADLDEDQVVEMIIGRKLERLSHRVDATTQSQVGEVAASVSGATGGSIHDVSFEVRAGEVLGLTGLLGSGFEEVLYFLFGARSPDAGSVTIDGKTTELASLSPRTAMAKGMALVPGDRHNDGSVPTLSITDNITVPVLKSHTRGLVLRRKEMHTTTAELMERYDVRPRDPRASYGTLSGGNQQKALMAKWLQIEPKLLLLHEPTQGVDVGAREQIYDVVRTSAAQGRSVLVASADHEQLAAVCDRVLVFGRGRVVSELRGSDVTKDRITEQCFSSLALADSTTQTA